MNRIVSRTVRVSAIALALGGTTWFVGQAVAGLVVVHVVGSLLHHVVRGIAAVG